MAITEERFRAVEIQVAVLKESMDHIGQDRDKNLATKADISALRGELKEDIGNLKDRVGNLEGTNRWLVGIGISILLAVLYQIVDPLISGFIP